MILVDGLPVAVDALLVVDGGKPIGVVTRADLLGHISARTKG